MKEILISKDTLKQSMPFLDSKTGDLILRAAFRLGGINKVNAIYDASKHLTGLAFVDDMLQKLNIRKAVENYEILDAFADKPFITVSNHPFGHVDGIVAISVVAAKRSDYKMMVNWMLSQIDTMDEHFIGVNPYSKDSKMADAKSSIAGVKQCLQHIREGHPLGLFPAGAVSHPHLTGTCDRQWQPTVLKLIKKARVPVIPLYIAGNNSLCYRALGFISWRLRMLRLLHEVNNKSGKTIRVALGQPVAVEVQDRYTDIKEFGEFLKQQTYNLK